MPSGFRAATPNNLVLDTGVFSYLVGSTETFVGVTRGEMGFEPNIEYRQPEYNGRRHMMAGMDRIVGFGSRMTGIALMEIDATILALLLPGATAGVVGDVTTLTPEDAGVTIAKGSLIKNPKLTYQISGGGLYQVEFDYGLVVEKTLNTADKDEGSYEITIEARVDPAAVGYTTDMADFREIFTAP
jgi:hypothetical protein